MKRAASDFTRALFEIIKFNRLQADTLRITQRGKQITPVSLVGKDLASGVLIVFSVDVWNGCTIEDYKTGELNTIKIPDRDTHPYHVGQ